MPELNWQLADHDALLSAKLSARVCRRFSVQMPLGNDLREGQRSPESNVRIYGKDPGTRTRRLVVGDVGMLQDYWDAFYEFTVFLTRVHA